MSKIKQFQLDIIESQSETEDGVQYAFPNHAVYPTKVAVFDDRDMVVLPTDDIRLSK